MFRHALGIDMAWGVTFRVSGDERSLVVFMHSSAKPSRQSLKAAKRNTGIIKRTIVST